VKNSNPDFLKSDLIGCSPSITFNIAYIVQIRIKNLVQTGCLGVVGIVVIFAEKSCEKDDATSRK